MNIIGTGLSGLVGTRCVQLLSKEHSFINLSLETGIDITQIGLVEQIFVQNDAPWVIHMAAFTDVDKAEADKKNGKNGIVWNVNVNATNNLVVLCKKYKKKLLYISTDFVFDGEKSSYTEEDVPHPLGWYGQTKYEGEKLVMSLGEMGLIARIANPYRDSWSGKMDFVHKILQRLQNNQRVIAPTDQIFVPTYIDDIIHALRMLMTKNCSGIYHVVGTGSLTPYEAIRRIISQYNYSPDLLQKTVFSEFFKDRAPRPFHAHLINDKITHCGMNMKSFREGLQKIYSLEKGN